MSTSAIERIRDHVATGTVSRSGLARAAGLHANTLRDLDAADWNPTADTLRKLETYLSANSDRPALVPIEEIIDEARNGRMYILVDDEDRENEGDLIIPAQMATPDAINFMATHGRGLICLAMTKARVEQLGLEPMSRSNGTRHETAFTVSIEAREGVTTGISAGDRARTIAVAIDAGKARVDIVTPGHVFPLVARDGGVLVRTGHTEAAVDVSRLAGLNPSGVICEIMKDDGTMARMDDLIPFARLHGLKMGTIRDLIAYRRKHDHLIERRAEMEFESRWGGHWKAVTFFNKATGDETMALVKGRIDPAVPTLVRMHTLSMFVDVFAEDSERAGLLSRSMEAIAEAGSGVLVLINKPMTGVVSRFMQLRAEGKGAGDREVEELRDYGGGAQILAELGVHDMILLTNTHHTLVGLEGYGLSIVGERPIPGTGGECPVTVGLWLAGFSALTTALAHALVKSATDKLAVQACVRLVGLAVATPLAIWIGMPPGYLWPWLIAAAATHAVYQALLSYSYSISDFSLAYPIARGIAPILTAGAGVLLLEDELGGWLVLAIATVSIGILMLAAGGRLPRAGLLAAMATGVLTTAYSVIDAKGMRLSPDLLTFVAWFFVLDGVAMPLLFVCQRRSDAPAAFIADLRPGLAAAVMTPVSFVPALYAFALAPVGAVAAIREASVLIAMLIAGRVLGERVDARRLLGAALIMAGIVGIIAASAR